MQINGAGDFFSMPCKIRRSGRNQKEVDVIEESARKILSNEGWDKSRRQRREQHNHQKRIAAIMSAKVGDFIEQAYPTERGKKA